jgi:hypothetical protein
MGIVAANAGHWAARLARVYLFGYRMSRRGMTYAFSPVQGDLGDGGQVLPRKPYIATKQHERLLVGTGAAVRVARVTGQTQFIDRRAQMVRLVRRVRVMTDCTATLAKHWFVEELLCCSLLDALCVAAYALLNDRL